QDLDPVAVGEAVPSLLLTPQGKLDVILRARRAAETEWWLDTDAAFGPRLAASLQRFRIRVDVELDDRTASTGMLSIVGGTVDVPAPLVALPTTWGDVAGGAVLGPRSGV